MVGGGGWSVEDSEASSWAPRETGLDRLVMSAVKDRGKPEEARTHTCPLWPEVCSLGRGGRTPGCHPMGRSGAVGASCAD